MHNINWFGYIDCLDIDSAWDKFYNVLNDFKLSYYKKYKS